RRCARRRTGPKAWWWKSSVAYSLGRSGGRFESCEEFACPQGDVDQRYKDGNLDQRAHYSGQSLAAGGAEGGDGYRDGQLEVVAGGGERQGGGARVTQL